MRNASWYPLAALAAALITPSAVAGPFYVPAVREMTERRSATERHYLLADGTYKAEVHLIRSARSCCQQPSGIRSSQPGTSTALYRNRRHPAARRSGTRHERSDERKPSAPLLLRPVTLHHPARGICSKVPLAEGKPQ